MIRSSSSRGWRAGRRARPASSPGFEIPSPQPRPPLSFPDAERPDRTAAARPLLGRAVPAGAGDGVPPDLARLSPAGVLPALERALRSEEHTSELQSLIRISYAVFCLKKKNNLQ